MPNIDKLFQSAVTNTKARLETVALASEAKIREAAHTVEDGAAKLVIEATDMIEHHKGEDRAIGATVGLKVGFVAAVLGAKIILPVAVVTGALMGPAGMEKFRGWRDQKRKELYPKNDKNPDELKP